MFKERKDAIQTITKLNIVRVSEDYYGIHPDNPTNWIIVSLFAVLTIALLLVVLYLSKHKVNHVEEHYDQMQKDNSSANGEIAA